jgi:hypothetical protein
VFRVGLVFWWGGKVAAGLGADGRRWPPLAVVSSHLSQPIVNRDASVTRYFTHLFSQRESASSIAVDMVPAGRAHGPTFGSALRRDDAREPRLRLHGAPHLEMRSSTNHHSR